MIDQSLERYSRQIIFSHLGKKCQCLLMDSSVVVVGCGALGTVSSSYLVRAGIGNIKIIDRDYIEESNLQRQILFDEDDIAGNFPKAVAAQRKLQKINSNINIEGVVTDINCSNIGDLIKDADVVIDGTDNFETRFLINDYCVKNNIPWIYGACIGSRGLMMNIIPSMTPCLSCVFETMPQMGSFPTCDTAGVIGPIAGIIASLQVTEAIKIVTKDYESTNKALYEIDVWSNKYKNLDISTLKESNSCPTCKLRNYKFLESEDGVLVSFLCGKNAIQIMARNAGNIDFPLLAKRLGKLTGVKYNTFMLKFKVSDNDFTIFPDGRAIITGTNDVSIAKNLYSRYIGM